MGRSSYDILVVRDDSMDGGNSIRIVYTELDSLWGVLVHAKVSLIRAIVKDLGNVICTGISVYKGICFII